MIGSFRNFAKTKFAGILVFIIIIPFVFWGMGSMFSGGNTNSISKRAEKLLTEFSENGGIIHVSEGSFLTFGVNQQNSNKLLIGLNEINWSYPKQLIEISSNADIVFSY